MRPNLGMEIVSESFQRTHPRDHTLPVDSDLCLPFFSVSLPAEKADYGPVPLFSKSFGGGGLALE